MKLKKILSLVISAAMLFGMITNVHAEETYQILAMANPDQTKVTVTGNWGESEGLLTPVSFTLTGDVEDSELFLQKVAEE